MSKLLSFKEFVNESEIDESTKRISRIRRGIKQLNIKVSAKKGFKLVAGKLVRILRSEKLRKKWNAIKQWRRGGPGMTKGKIKKKKTFAIHRPFLKRQREKNKKNKK